MATRVLDDRDFTAAVPRPVRRAPGHRGGRDGVQGGRPAGFSLWSRSEPPSQPNRAGLISKTSAARAAANIDSGLDAT